MAFDRKVIYQLKQKSSVKGFFKSNANDSLDMFNSILGYKLASKYNMQNRGYFFRVYRA